MNRPQKLGIGARKVIYEHGILALGPDKSAWRGLVYLARGSADILPRGRACVDRATGRRACRDLGRHVGAVAPSGEGGVVAAVRERFVRLDADLYEQVLAGCSLTSPDCASAAGPGGSIPFGRGDAALPRNSSRPQPRRATPTTGTSKTPRSTDPTRVEKVSSFARSSLAPKITRESIRLVGFRRLRTSATVRCLFRDRTCPTLPSRRWPKGWRSANH